jgi:hypothetical protein
MAFSILLPVRDAAQSLPLALRSILRQSEPSWECVVVDDGSLDESLSIARAFARSDARFRVIEREALGIVSALNAGLRQCSGRYVARMDADDCMHRHRLCWQRAELERVPELSGVGGHVRLFPRAGLSDGLRTYEAWLNSIREPAQLRSEAWIECPIAHPTLCMRRDVLLEFGYRDCGWPEDYDLILRLLDRGLSLGVVPRRLLLWRDRVERLSRTSAAYAIERFTECKASHLASGFLAHTREYTLWGYGKTGKTLARALARHGKHPNQIVELHPGRLGQRIAGAPVIHPDALRSLPKQPLIASVAGGEARSQIRQALREMGFRELTDFVVAA